MPPANHNRQIDELRRYIDGGPTPSNGLLVRVDRLEERVKRAEWWQRIIITALIGSIATASVAYWTHTEAAAVVHK